MISRYLILITYIIIRYTTILGIYTALRVTLQKYMTQTQRTARLENFKIRQSIDVYEDRTLSTQHSRQRRGNR